MTENEIRSLVNRNTSKPVSLILWLWVTVITLAYLYQFKGMFSAIFKQIAVEFL